MIFVSTGGFKNQKISEVIEKFTAYGITGIELSGCMHDPLWEKAIMKHQVATRFRAHNYFPVPSAPFVLNLASQNEEQLELSLNHVEYVLTLCGELGIDTYTVHAGFCVDLKPSQLGRDTKSQALWDNDLCLKTFASSYKTISKFAKDKGVRIAIENNVLTKQNMSAYGKDCLLLVDYTSYCKMASLIGEFPPLLTDVGHLNVSALTLGLDREEQLLKLLPYTVGLHLSDNDGFRDSNSMIRVDSWFMQHIKSRGIDSTLEIYENNYELLAKQYKLAVSFFK